MSKRRIQIIDLQKQEIEEKQELGNTNRDSRDMKTTDIY